MDQQSQTEIITLVIVVLVVARFLVRELGARTVRLSSLWVRPAVLLALTAFLVVVTLRLAPWSSGLLLPSLGAGMVVGVVVGFLVAGSTRVEAVGKAGFVRLRGSWVTVAIWVAALALRLLVRFLSGGFTSQSSPAANSGTLMLVAVAFATFSVLVAQRARTYGLDA